ncbi:ABC transporter substrate-binding protein [Uliginosibacterium sp. 31-12]|uniref:ABC transporter substrate-binding protein n=1 Tax=Uliginosibacterium sp. 31-12 TaxID=3062781 RepID=UPI0026E27E4C|nr:ABC transporter substrate-binding protein [Uliginosibacterium sp. 31-12]MDO6384830.1 ABC transporter substrate-binding protein [Uliginosibacterium sp. 31-12]
MRGLRGVLALLVVCALSACGDSDKIRIGFLGGLSGRYQDLGNAGRDGATLAVEMRNAQGGVGGRLVELVARDDEQDATQARRALDDLVAMQVAAVVGPMTSSVAVAVAPRLAQTGTVMLGVHTTTTELTGKDDMFFRVIDDTNKYASEVARFHYQRRNVRQVAILYDLANVDYSASWVADYKRTIEGLGGAVVRSISFDSHYERKYDDMARTLLDVAPDMVVIVANAVDTAEIVGKLRGQNERVQLAGCGWANTERLLENGGKQIEGLLLEEYVDLEDFSRVYQDFREAYVQRFKKEPSYGASMAYEAANIVMDALSHNPDPRQLKQTLLSVGSFRGVQGNIRFDPYGDVQRSVFFAEVRDGRFQRLR